MKKLKLLFVSELSSIGGTERALVELIKALPVNKYDITLRLFGEKGNIVNEIPDSVRIQYVESIRGYRYVCNELMHFRFANVLNFILNWFRTHWGGYDRFRDYLNSTIKYWSPDEFYDVAIASHTPLSIPNLYTYKRVKSKYKILFIHANISAYQGCETIREYFDCFCKVYCVSEAAKTDFINYFPAYSNKTSVLYNRLDIDRILRLSNEGPEYIKKKSFRIVSCSRLVNEKQPYYALLVSKYLLDRGIDNFEWYYIGYGYLLEDLREEVTKQKLNDNLFFSGASENPYLMIKSADVFVNTSSNHEAFCLSIEEARILHIPVVTTDFDAAKEQIVNGFNGYLVDKDSWRSLAIALERLILNPKMLLSIKRKSIEDRDFHQDDYLNLIEFIDSICKNQEGK